MSKRDDFFLILGKRGATKRDARNAFHALAAAIDSPSDPDLWDAAERLLLPYSLKLTARDRSASLAPLFDEPNRNKIGDDNE